MQQKLNCLLLSLALAVGFIAATNAQAKPLPDIHMHGDNVVPESITSSADGTVFIGSFAQAAVLRALPGQDTTELRPWIDADSGGLQSVLGVFADDAANILWVCSNPPRSDDSASASTGDLIAFDLTTGKLRKRYRFPSSGGRCNDIAVDGNRGKVTTIKEGFPGGPTGVTRVGNTAYVVETQIRAMRPAEGVQRLPFTAHAIPLAAAATGPMVGDIAVGQHLFAERCSLCHSTDSRSGTGPGLGGITGEPAASSEFAFTDELRNAGLTWDSPTLDRYLASPGEVVPGTAMAVTTPVAAERREIIAYLATLVKGNANADEETSQRTAATEPGDWNYAVPGRRYHITTADLAKPFATPSASNSGPAARQPNGASLAVPKGFTVKPFAKLVGPRTLRVAPNGDIFVAETRRGRITVLRADDGAGEPAETAVFAEDLERPFGIAFYPTQGTPEWVYVATLNSVLRFPYRMGDMTARGGAEVVVDKLADTTAGHSTRDIVFSRDDKRMFVSVGSQSNIAETMGTKTAAEIRSWEATRRPGAAWGNEANRADVLVFTPDGKDDAIFASGIRNCVSMALQPRSDAFWCVTNERDLLGDNLVPDYATAVKEGAFYGWPWYYLGNHEDPRLQGQRPDLAGKITVPDVLFQAHSAALGVAFYDAANGPAAFPTEYQGDAFVTFHGSWNRGVRTGYKVVRMIMQDGVATGAYEDFLTGFVIDNDNAWGRPTGVAVAHDGALLVSDDGSNTLWRIAYDR